MKKAQGSEPGKDRKDWHQEQKQKMVANRQKLKVVKKF